MEWLKRLRARWRTGTPKGPVHLETGRLGEMAARRALSGAGLVFLTANFRGKHGEIDLVMREADCIAFIEVKTRSSEDWTRPAAAVDRAKRRRVVLTSEEYIRRLPDPRVKWRYDVVEVLWEGGDAREIRHIRNAFEPKDARLIRR
jgi:putative endonuclease